MTVEWMLSAQEEKKNRVRDSQENWGEGYSQKYSQKYQGDRLESSNS